MIIFNFTIVYIIEKVLFFILKLNLIMKNLIYYYYTSIYKKQLYIVYICVQNILKMLHKHTFFYI